MNQEKIGKFIAKCRKEKNMTQEELAEKLKVTDRAVSHWENGRRMPDYSIVKDLCLSLDISINDFFAGEKIVSSNYKNKADSNLNQLIDIININNKRFERNMIILLIISTIITMIIIYLLPLKTFKDIIIFILIITLTIISNTINIIAQAKNNN